MYFRSRGRLRTANATHYLLATVMWTGFSQSRSRLLASLSCTLALCFFLVLCCTAIGEDLAATEPPLPPAPKSTILPNSPRFVLRLPDNQLLCFSIEGYETFTYNLITSNYFVLNGFVRVAPIQLADMETYNKTRGFGDLGMTMKAVDRRVRSGKRFFKHLIYGEKKKAIMEGFGEVDLDKGAVTFALNNGHSNIESQQSAHEKFRLILDKPKTDILAVSSNGHTFNVYVEDGSGLMGIDMHGIIGQFYHPKVRIDDNYKELHLADGRVVPVEEGAVWEGVVDDGYGGERCWYPLEGKSVIEGKPWEYVVEHIMSTKYKYSLFSKK